MKRAPRGRRARGSLALRKPGPCQMAVSAEAEVPGRVRPLTQSPRSTESRTRAERTGHPTREHGGQAPAGRRSPSSPAGQCPQCPQAVPTPGVRRTRDSERDRAEAATFFQNDGGGRHRIEHAHGVTLFLSFVSSAFLISVIFYFEHRHATLSFLRNNILSLLVSGMESILRGTFTEQVKAI